MLMEQRRVVEWATVIRISNERNRAAAEVDRSASVIEHNLNAGWVRELLRRSHSRRERRHSGGWIAFQKFDYAIDIFGRHLGLVALHVYQNLSAWTLACHFRDPISAACAIWTRHHEVAAEAFDLAGNLGMVGRDDNAGRFARGARGFIRVLQECLARLAQQHFARQAGRRISGRSNGEAARRWGTGARTDRY